LFSTSPMLQIFTSVFINHITIGSIEFYLIDWMEPIKQVIAFYIMLEWAWRIVFGGIFICGWNIFLGQWIICNSLVFFFFFLTLLKVQQYISWRTMGGEKISFLPYSIFFQLLWVEIHWAFAGRLCIAASCDTQRGSYRTECKGEERLSL